MTTSTVSITQPPQVAPAWWIHWLNLALAAAAFVATVVQPGYHLPAIYGTVVGPLSIVLAIGSGALFAVLHHKTGVSNLRALYDYVASQSGSFLVAANQLAPLIDRVPGLDARLKALEAAAQSPQEPPTPPPGLLVGGNTAASISGPLSPPPGVTL